MASWVTHLMIADGVLAQVPEIDKRGFCVGSIAPDCNVENEDWTAFTPSREVTHWMQGKLKCASDAERFCNEYILQRRAMIQSDEEYAFLLGYYAHLIADAAFQKMITDENRVRAVWLRIRCDKTLAARSVGMEKTWDAVKALIPKKEQTREIRALEAEYLREHPDSGYLTELLGLKSFPDYIDYLPKGCIVRKIGIMGYIPPKNLSTDRMITISKEEFSEYKENTIRLTVEKFRENGLII